MTMPAEISPGFKYGAVKDHNGKLLLTVAPGQDGAPEIAAELCERWNCHDALIEHSNRQDAVVNGLLGERERLIAQIHGLRAALDAQTRLTQMLDEGAK
jgi:hypothetical protein